MDRGRVGRVARRGLLGLAIVVATMGACVVLIQNAFNYDPPNSAESLRREQVLLHLPIRDLRVEGRGPISVYSDPGREQGDGDFQLGQSVEVTRTYVFAGDPVATCATVLARLLADGWTVDEFSQGCDKVDHTAAHPDLELGPSDHLGVLLTFDCAAFVVRGHLSLNIAPDRDPPRTLSMKMETTYPSDQADDSTTTSVPPLAVCT